MRTTSSTVAVPPPVMAETLPDLTPEQLALAYRHLRRPHWPDTLDAALAHATYGVCIRGLARNLRRQSPVAAQRRCPLQRMHGLPAVPPEPPPPAVRRITRANDHFPHGGISTVSRAPAPDRKRLAANDHDD